MTTKPCPDCGKPVSSTATKCPHCGGELVFNQAKMIGYGCILPLAVVLILGWLGWC